MQSWPRNASLLISNLMREKCQCNLVPDRAVSDPLVDGIRRARGNAQSVPPSGPALQPSGGERPGSPPACPEWLAGFTRDCSLTVSSTVFQIGPGDGDCQFKAQNNDISAFRHAS